jgi:hypothetical protein
MNQEIIPQSYRGVLCKSCRQPIPLPAILVNMEAAVGIKEPGSTHEYHSRVFSLRCRACEREKPYRASEVADFQGVPRTRVSRARLAHALGHKSHSHSRASNC